MRGRTVLITGATRGIGLATAMALAVRGATIIAHGRDPKRVTSACESIRRVAPGAAVDGMVADLGSLAEVRRLAEDVQERHARLDVLINNAGLATRHREVTVDGFERQFAVNHLAPFLLTRLLLERLRASDSARIITVASMAHRRAAFDLDDLNWERRPYRPVLAYGATKLANILFTRELAGRLDGSGITANCLHPGVVATHLFAGLGAPGRLFGLLSKPFLRSTSAGAVTSVFLATNEAVAGISGEFFHNAQIVEPDPPGRDADAARLLWQLSEQFTAHVS